MRSAVIAFLLAGLLGSSALADVVTLKDGSRREGKIVKEDDEEVILEIAQGRLKAQVILKRSEISEIEKGPTANEKLLAEVKRKRKALSEKDTNGWLEFAEWLDQQDGFSKDALEAYEKVISLDGDNEVARRRLGYCKVGGQWLTEEEVMIAKGYVRSGSGWVKPEEKAAEDKPLADVTFALAEDAKKKMEDKAEADAKARERWLEAMQQLAEEKAAQQQAAAQAAADSGGVVLGPYGYGYYGVRTAGGEYIPYVPATAPGYFYTGTVYGTCPYVITTAPYGVSTSRRSSVSTGVNWGVHYADKHWDIGLSSGGRTRIIYTKKK